MIYAHKRKGLLFNLTRKSAREILGCIKKTPLERGSKEGVNNKTDLHHLGIQQLSCRLKGDYHEQPSRHPSKKITEEVKLQRPTNGVRECANRPV